MSGVKYVCSLVVACLGLGLAFGESERTHTNFSVQRKSSVPQGVSQNQRTVGPRFAFPSGTEVIVELPNQYESLLGECKARWPELIDEQAPFGVLLPEKVAQYVEPRILERRRDEYQVLGFRSLNVYVGEISRFTFHSHGAHAGLDGFMAVLDIASRPFVQEEASLRPAGLAWRQHAPLNLDPSSIPMAQDAEAAKLTEFVSLSFPEWTISKTESKPFWIERGKTLGVAVILRGDDEGDILLAVGAYVDDKPDLVRVDTSTTRVTCLENRAFYLHEAQAEHCEAMENGSFYLLPDIDNDNFPELVIVSDVVSSLLSFRDCTLTAPGRRARSFCLTEVYGFSYGF